MGFGMNAVYQIKRGDEPPCGHAQVMDGFFGVFLPAAFELSAKGLPAVMEGVQHQGSKIGSGVWREAWLGRVRWSVCLSWS